MEQNSKNLISSWISKEIVIVVIVGAVLLFMINSVNTKVGSLQSDLALLRDQVSGLSVRLESQEILSNLQGVVDLTSPSLQSIGEGFYVSRLKVGEHPSGIKVSGKIVNGSSLIHENVKFNITVGSKTKEFSVLQRIIAGGSAYFEVVIPDVKGSEANYAQIQYQSSLVRYY